jgi:phenylalanyl-tRNA synthetase beta chain
MKIPLSLIKSFLHLELSIEKIAEVLTLLGIEVDRIHEGDVFELSLTPNLGHCMSALGIARELSAALQIPMKSFEASLPKKHLDLKIIVRNETLCPHYMCCLIEDIQVSPSPSWLKEELEACGQKSINNVVDITNYVMLKFGNPLHAFDYDLLEGNAIKVDLSAKEESFLGLDEVERTVPKGSLFIFDAKKPIALAGIMGGANSSISEKTKRVLFEAASFDPIQIRNTSRKIALRSESSQRFEKGVDPLGMETALQEVCQLLGGTFKGYASFSKDTPVFKKIPYRIEKINRLLGLHLSQTEIEEIFTRLQFKPKNGLVEVPLYRTDIQEEIDLVEEVARIYGYNNIDKPTPYCTTSQIPSDPLFIFENEMRRRFVALGLTEFLNCDLLSPKLAEIAHEITPKGMDFLKASYSKSEEYSVLRTSLLPGLLQVTQKNIDQKNLNLAAFEIGRIHFLSNAKVTEIPMGAILLTGKARPSHWSQKSVDFDYFDLKAMIEELSPAHFRPSQHLFFHPNRQADVYLNDILVGSLGEIHPSLLEKFHIEQRVYYAEFHLPYLMQLKKKDLKMKPLPPFPSSERDATLPIDSQVPIDAIFDAIKAVHSPLLEKIELIDLYIPQNALQKNATFRFTYRDALKTISFEEVEREHAKIQAHIAKLLAK